jgi:parallel beta-helix repeat protein
MFSSRLVRRCGLLLSFLSLGGFATARADDFYVDNSSGSCSDAGPGTAAQPYCTISAAVTAHHGPGINIFVKPGTYREQVTIPVSGASGSPFVLQAQGGAVTVDGADDLSSAGNWIQFSGDVYLAAGVTWAPSQVFMDGSRLTPSTVATPASVPERSFLWVSGQGLFVNAGGGSPAAHELLVGRRQYGFLAAGRSYVTIDGFTVTRAELRCLLFNNVCTNIVVSHNVISFAYKYGMQAVDGSAFLIDSNTVSDNNDHGIMLLSGVTSSTIQNNESLRNARPGERAANGIHLYGCPGNLIQNNRVHDNQDSGIQVESGSNDCLVVQNRSWNNGDHGYDNIFSTGTRYVGDVAFHNTNDGFSVEGPAPSTVLRDCIAAENGLTTNHYDLFVDSGSALTFDSNNNLFWNSTSQPPVKYADVPYTTLSSYNGATGQDAQSIQADPAFKSPWAGDFHLVAGSPAIDAANSGVVGWPATDAAGNPRVDDPATVNTGVGPISYADLGALEFPASGPTVVRPVASLVVTPALGTDPQGVTADASGSSDPDGSIISYVFDFGDGVVVGPQSRFFPTTTHTYAAGTWVATVIVTDNVGAARSASAQIVISPGANGDNFVTNSSFEANIDGWNAFNGCTLSQVAGGEQGNFSLQMNATGPTLSSFGANDHPDWIRNTAAANLIYRFSAWVRSASSTGKAEITIKEYLLSNGELVGSAATAPLTLSPQWQKITLDYTTNSPGSTLDFQVRDFPVAVGEVFQTDNISIELIQGVLSAEGLLPHGPLEPRIYPNPAVSTATLTFATTQPGRLRVDLFDVAGRRVRRLLDTPAASAGPHRLAIERAAQGDEGPLHAGLYLYRIDTPDGAVTGRFCLLR